MLLIQSFNSFIPFTILGHAFFRNSSENDNLEVVNLVFMGPAEQKGMDFFDEVTRIEINSLDRPAKEYVYLVGLLVLLLTFYSQRRLITKSY